MAERRQRIAVLGGGPAAITAAFELTATPELRERFEVTVYQLGWRLGGKCASGRNQAHGSRIEEHGLHVWFGFYDNAFRVMRDAYEELARPAGHPLATLEEAFHPCDQIVLYDHLATGWHSTAINFPRNDHKPGETHELPTFFEIVAHVCTWALTRWRELLDGRPELRGPAATHHHRFTPDWFTHVAVSLGVGAADEASRAGEQLLELAGRLAGVRIEAMPRLGLGLGPLDLLTKLICGFRDLLWEHVVRERCDRDPDLRMFFTIFDVFACATQGIVEDGVLEHGWDAIDRYDLTEWLARHGATEITVGKTPAERAPALRAIYDVAFAYRDGDIGKPDAAAGAAMNDLLRLAFSYRGSIMYKMQAGMGDTVLTPFYETLRRRTAADGSRSVHFEFFTEVTKLHTSADGKLIEAVELVDQVDLMDGIAEYEPLVPVGGLECWPSEPVWHQIDDRDGLQAKGVDLEVPGNPLGRKPRRLRLGDDFDAVVLGIPVAALPAICEEVADAQPAFKRMLDTSATVQTQAFQVWLTKTTPELGYPHDPNSVTGCYVEPLDTWCDMTHLLPREAWPVDLPIAAIVYLCGVLDERPGESGEQATARAKANALAFLTGDVGSIWPRAVGTSNEIDWSLIADPDGRAGAERFDSQYWRANTTPSERYVLTPKGSVQHRLRAHESGVDNLVLAGDWTRNGVDGGCVEAAVLSGLQAARALIDHDRSFTGEDPRWLSGSKRG